MPVDPAAAFVPSPLIAVRRHWLASGLVVLLGLVVGVLGAAAKATTYSASARLAVGGDDIASQVVPGFALAQQQLAATYARFVGGDQVTAAVRTRLGAEAGAVTAVAASPIPESGIILVQATGTSASAAAQGAEAAAEALRDAVNAAVASQSDPTAVLDQYTAAVRAVQAAQSAQDQATSSHAPQATIDADEAKLSAAQLQQAALNAKYQQLVAGTGSSPASGLVLTQRAVADGSDRRSRLERYGLGGLGAGLVLMVPVAMLLSARRRPALTSSFPPAAQEVAPFASPPVTAPSALPPAPAPSTAAQGWPADPWMPGETEGTDAWVTTWADPPR